MSRVGKKIVAIPDGVEVELSNKKLTAKGKRGVLSVELSHLIEASKVENSIVVKPKSGSKSDSKKSREMWGTMRQMIAQTIIGVSQGFKRQLVFEGVGYRASVAEKTLKLSLGYSHDIMFPIPEGMQISISPERNNIIIVEGNDKQQVGQVASLIRDMRPVEPYKGKGLRYLNAFVRRKEGKKK